MRCHGHQCNMRLDFAGNTVRIAKYSLLTFLPWDLFEDWPDGVEGGSSANGGTTWAVQARDDRRVGAQGRGTTGAAPKRGKSSAGGRERREICEMASRST